MMRRRRPILRGAMVGGAGYMAGKAAANCSAREQSQEERLAEMEAAQAPTSAPAGNAPPAAGASTVDQLRQLGELRENGVLTPEEFEREKQKILGRG
jgi:Short C-terminal domain